MIDQSLRLPGVGSPILDPAVEPVVHYGDGAPPQWYTRDRWVPPDLAGVLNGWKPRSDFGQAMLKALRYLPRDLACELVDRLQSITVVESELRLVVLRSFGLLGYPLSVEDYGVVSRKVVTNAGVAFIVDAFDNTVEAEIMNYHALGTGTNAEAVGDTALQTELTTEYTGNVRATGTQTQPSANIYRTTGLNTLDSGTPAITEHGVMSQAATGGGTLLDRSVFSAINLTGANGDALSSQYSLTLTAGS